MSLVFRSLASSSLGCCYILSGGGASAPLLIDAGIRFAMIQRGTGFQAASLAGCLISHAHGDHIASAGQLMAEGVDCFASIDTWDHYYKDGPRSHYARSCELGKQFKVGDWNVLPVEAVHDVPGTFGFLIGSPEGHSLLYMTDTAYVKNTFPGLTHLAIEANFDGGVIRDNKREGKIHAGRYTRTHKTHMSIDTLCDMLRSNDLSKLQEVHLLHLSKANSNAAEFKKRVQEIVGVPVYVCDEFSAEVKR